MKTRKEVEALAREAIRRTVSKEDASGWCRVANRDVLVMDVADAINTAHKEGMMDSAKTICSGCFSEQETKLVDGIMQHQMNPKATNPYWYPCSASAIRKEAQGE